MDEFSAVTSGFMHSPEILIHNISETKLKIQIGVIRTGCAFIEKVIQYNFGIFSVLSESLV